MTAEMLRSDDPCAIARMLTPAAASAPKTLAAMPGVPAMPSPTTDRMLQPPTRSTFWIWPCRSSVSNACRTVRSVSAASASGTAKQIECSELPCEIRITETPSSRSAPNSRSAVPGHADHPGALDVDQRDLLDAGDPLDRVRRHRRLADQRSRLLRRERVADPDRNPLLHRRRHRLRMNHLGAEVRELHRLVIGERVDHRRVGHAARIGAEHAVDVGPDVNLARRRAGRRRSTPRNRCRCVRASSAAPSGRAR